MSQYIYETIGAGYTQHRHAEPGLVQKIVQLLALPAQSWIVDVGAGTGNYSATFADLGYRVIALEPAAMMRRQAQQKSDVRWLAGAAEAMPLRSGAAKGAVCILALHHMRSVAAVAQEMHRVVADGRFVILTFDPRLATPWWFEHYFPTVWHEAFTFFPPLDTIVEQFNAVAATGVEIVPYVLPAILNDRFAAAGWHMPELYLDPAVRAGMSAFALADQSVVNDGVARLRRDLDTGEWHRQNAHILRSEVFDAGYRLLVVT